MKIDHLSEFVEGLAGYGKVFKIGASWSYARMPPTLARPKMAVTVPVEVALGPEGVLTGEHAAAEGHSNCGAPKPFERPVGEKRG